MDGWMDGWMTCKLSLGPGAAAVYPLYPQGAHILLEFSLRNRMYTMNKDLKGLRETRKMRKENIPPGPCIKGRICADAGRRNKTSPMGPGSKAANTGRSQAGEHRVGEGGGQAWSTFHSRGAGLGGILSGEPRQVEQEADGV